jgi:hypothetical protein
MFTNNSLTPKDLLMVTDKFASVSFFMNLVQVRLGNDPKHTCGGYPPEFLDILSPHQRQDYNVTDSHERDAVHLSPC